ncbi:MAG: tetratricopeptide repeat protein [Hyphomonadaceae bacterium]
MTEASAHPRRRVRLAFAEASRDLAAPLARALEAAGFDAMIAGGDNEADVMLVCWTPAGVASDSVNLEAARARKAKKLAAVLLAPCAPPASFGHPLADLSAWRGDPSAREILPLVHALHAQVSKRPFSGGLWKSDYLSWGGLGAATLGLVAIIANLGGLTQTIGGLVDPAASQRALSATDAKVEEVLTLLKQKSPSSLSADAEAALRDSIERLLAAQDGARGQAASKLESGDLDGARMALQTAAREGEKVIAGLSETWLEIGALAYLSDTFGAINAYKRASQLNPENAQTFSMLGSLYMRVGRIDEAQQAFEQMMNVADTDSTMARALGNLGVAAMARGELDQAEQYFGDSLEVNTRAGDLGGQGQDLNDLGEIYRVKGQFAKAEDYMRRALKLATEAGHPEGMANVQLRLGRLAADRGRIAEATASYTRSREISEALGDSEGMSAAMNSLAEIEFNRGRIDAASKIVEQSLALAQEVSARESEAFAHGLIGEIAEKRGEMNAAIEHYREARTIYTDIGMADTAAPFVDMLARVGATPSPEGPEN